MRHLILTQHPSPLLLVISCSIAALTGCVRDVPGTTCDTTQDCYQGYICEQGACVPEQDIDMKIVPDADMDTGRIDQGDMTPDADVDLKVQPDADMAPVDMPDMTPVEMGDMSDMSDMADMEMGDMPIDMTDMPIDMPDMPVDMTDMPIDMPIDMPPDMPPPPDEYTTAAMSTLPGPRAALVQDNNVWILTAQNTTNALTLSKLDPVTHLPSQSYPISGALSWSVIDTSEKAALFSVDAIHIGVLFEDHTAVGKIKLYYVSFNIATGMASPPALVKETNNLDSPTIDFDLYGALPTVLVNTAGSVAILALDNGAWVDQTPIPVPAGIQLKDAHFITNANAVCGHLSNSLACYMKLNNGNWGLLNNPKLDNVTELRVAATHEHMVALQGQNLIFGPVTFDAAAPGQPVRFTRSQATLLQSINSLSVYAAPGGDISLTYTRSNDIVLLDPLGITPTQIVVTTGQDQSALILYGTQPYVFTSDEPTSVETTLFLP